MTTIDPDTFSMWTRPSGSADFRSSTSSPRTTPAVENASTASPMMIVFMIVSHPPRNEPRRAWCRFAPEGAVYVSSEPVAGVSPDVSVSSGAAIRAARRASASRSV